MLTELQIHNFLIIESLNLSFSAGMTVITGETGAGKSILLDALQFVAGGRSDARLIREGKTLAEVSAQFIVAPQSQASACLQDWGITLEEDSCVLRRVLGSDGRSKAYINQQLVSIQQLKTLGNLLINWVGQYEHQALLRQDAQLAALDEFAKAQPVLSEVSSSAGKIQDIYKQLEHLRNEAQKQQEIAAFKTYQLDILKDLSLHENEWDELHQEQKRLSSGDELMSKIASIIERLHEGEQNLIDELKRLEKATGQLANEFSDLQNPSRLCADALVHLEEAYYEFKAFHDSLELDPERLQTVEARLSEIHAVARKLQLAPEALFGLYQSLQDELQATGIEIQIKETENALQTEKNRYLQFAGELTAMRQSAAAKLVKHVTDEIKTLGMKEGEFKINLHTDPARFTDQGQEQVEFCIRTNPGQRWASLKEGASGGELSRIALVIAVLNARQNEAGTLVFDEVDVGVSGAVAEKVGALLRKLARCAQVLCITHLPQVAMLGEQHIHVIKIFENNQTFGSAKTLTLEERIEEVARIMSGENITDHARQLAREGLKSSLL